MERLFKLLQSDKVLHFLLCYFITTLGHWYFIGAGFALLFSLYKEYYDYKTPGHEASWFDLLAGLSGIAIGMIINIIK